MARKANKKMWEEIISSQKASGLKQANWCIENNVNIHNFRYWVGRLKALSLEKENNNDSTWAAVVLEDNSTPQSTTSLKSINDGLSIRIGKAIIEYNANVSNETFDHVVQVLMKYV